MNNEEKILSILETMQSDVSDLKAEVKQHGEVISELQTTVTRVAVTQENVVLPQLRLLAEGQQTLLDTLAPKSRVEALEEDMVILKCAVRDLSQQIEKMKRA